MIAGIVGRAGSGKDHLFDYLSRSGYAVRRYAWADSLREEIQEALNGGYYMDALWQKPYSLEVRSLLQWWGTDFRRKEDPDYWIRRMKDELISFAEGGPMEGHLAMVTDTRFPNEVETIKKMGGVIIRVWAPEKVRIKRIGEDYGSDHPTETMLEKEPADFTLVSSDGAPYGLSARDRALFAGLLQKVSKIR